MNPVEIKNTPESLQITLDKRFFDDAFLRETVDYFRMEYLAQRVNFDESIEELGDEIKRHWWQRNKSRFIQE
jgi:hypothetical protein